MKPVFLLAFLLFFTGLFAQKNKSLKFDQRIALCENKWVAFPPNEEGELSFGFVYIDEAAGFTFESKGSFTILENGSYARTSTEERNFSMKMRLEPRRTRNVAVIPDDKLADLNVLKTPEWLHFYTDHTDSVKRNVTWGYHYNHVGESAMALIFLLEAYEQDPHYKGLEFEIGFACNALGKYDKAIEVLEKAIAHDPNYFWFYREIGYSYIRKEDFKSADKIYTKAIEMCPEDRPMQKAEIAYNMGMAYYQIGEKKKFKKWSKIVLKNAPEDTDMYKMMKKVVDSI